MRTISILNLKGGVGKTVTAVNVAYLMAAAYQKRVLLIDADSQCNASEFFGAEPVNGNLADVLTSLDGGYCVEDIQSTSYDGLDLLPASDRLMDLDLTSIQQQASRAEALRELLVRLVETDRAYDVVLIDCPPAFNAAAAAALVASDEVIIPIKLDAFSLRGMGNLMRQVSNMRKINPALRVAGCLPTMYYNAPEIQDALEILQASDLPVFRTKIRRSNRVDGHTFAQQPLAKFSPHSSTSIDYKRFCRELLKGGRRNG